MNLLIVQNPYEFINFFYVLKKQIDVITVQLFAQSPRKFVCVILNLVTKTYPKFVTLRLFFKIQKKNSKSIEEH